MRDMKGLCMWGCAVLEGVCVPVYVCLCMPSLCLCVWCAAIDRILVFVPTLCELPPAQQSMIAQAAWWLDCCVKIMSAVCVVRFGFAFDLFGMFSNFNMMANIYIQKYHCQTSKGPRCLKGPGGWIVKAVSDMPNQNWNIIWIFPIQRPIFIFKNIAYKSPKGPRRYSNGGGCQGAFIVKLFPACGHWTIIEPQLEYSMNISNATANIYDQYIQRYCWQISPQGPTIF